MRFTSNRLQFADIKDAAHQGLGKGDTYHWNVYKDIATQGTTLTETSTIPESNFTVVQGTMTIGEMGNSVPFTGKLDDLSEAPVTEIINNVLKNDAAKAFDVAVFNEFNKTPLRAVAASGTHTANVTLTTNSTATLTNSVALRADHIRSIMVSMQERNIPAYEGDDYFCIAWPSTFNTVRDDLESIQQYTAEGFQMIMNGEIGRHNGVRLVQQTNIAKGGAADNTTWTATTSGDAWNNALSDWAFFFGEDTVAEAVAVPEEMRGKIPSDYGRSKGIAWLN